MRELTDKQREVLGFIRSFTARHTVPPTVREIGERFRVTPRAAFDHLRALERKGALQRRASARRDRKSTRLNSSHQISSYAGFCLKEKNRHGQRPLFAIWVGSTFSTRSCVRI